MSLTEQPARDLDALVARARLGDREALEAVLASVAPPNALDLLIAVFCAVSAAYTTTQRGADTTVRYGSRCAKLEDLDRDRAVRFHGTVAAGVERNVRPR